jgi:ADP-heptose:LPS heptosyltransferase
MKILYYYHDVCGLGDFYLLFPILDALRIKHKNDEITLLAREEIKDIAFGKNWFDKYLDTSHTDYPINRYDRVYNWDVQKNGITLFYPPKKHFWDIMETNYDIILDRSNFSNIFRLDLTDDEKHQVDQILPKNKTNIVIHTGHTHKFPYGKTPDYEWWYNVMSALPNCNFFQVGTKQESDIKSRIIPDFDVQVSNRYDLRDKFSLRQIAYLLEQTNTFVAIDSIITHLSLHSNKTGIVIWGSSNPKTHGHIHNINLEAIRHCGKSPCVDLGGFIVSDDRNQTCCLMPENSQEDSWPNIEDVIHEINILID